MKKHMYRVSAQILAAAALAAGGVVQAQAQETSATDKTAAANETEEVVVTGFRNSLARALDEKRDSAVAIDAILAEDIGKFPDLNLSESIQRVPGVALARDGGEGRQISVRGLGPQFTRVRINGMEALTTVGGADSSGGTNRGRSFDFNVFASDLFNSITVQKTADASTEEGSLGATVDLTTARPFDREGFVFTTSFQSAYNDLSEKTDPRGAMLISNTWGGGTFGALLSVAYTKRQVLEEGPSTVRWATGNAFAPGFAGPAPSGFTLAQLNAAFHPRFPRMEIYNIDQECLGMTGSLQWRPSDSTQLTLDALYADFSTDREEQQLEAPSFSVGGACTSATTASGACGIAQRTVTAATIDANNNLLAGTFNNVDIAVENRFDQLKTEFSQLTLSGTHDFNDRLTVNAVVGRSVSDHRNPVQTTLRFDQFNVQGYRYDFTVGRVPLLSYGSAQLNNPAAWRLTQVRLRPQTALNTYNTLQFDGKYKFADYLQFSAGYGYKEYYFKTTERRRTNGTTTNQETVIPAGVRRSRFPACRHLRRSTATGSTCRPAA